KNETRTTSGFDYGTKTTNGFDYGSKSTSVFDYGSRNTTTNGNHTHQALVQNVGGRGNNNFAAGGDGGVTSTSQPTYGAGDHAHTVSIGAHSHSVYIGAHNHTVDIGAHNHTLAIGAHTHTVTVNIEDADHTHSGATGNTGGGQAFSVEQPSYVVYIWKRVA
ncbi:hypothetical protein, partial [Polaribacter pacificus]|uniref:hypothetical protein n=1 Tax=Polaribacter pacificus TaxID=1775173 RepID=UPI00403297DA